MSQEILEVEDTYPIKGIPLVPGQEIPVRCEITAWSDDKKNKTQVSLFIQSLAKLQAKPVEERLSYFQIAGIHCYPLVGWDGEKGVPDKHKKDPFPGYCAHNRVTFPTWHRPYLLLYEQVLHELMLEIIASWTSIDQKEKDIWLDSANKFRLPYWDWARTNGIPRICREAKISILMPGYQTQQQVDNPLVKFRNPKLDSKGENVAMGDPSMKENAIKDDTAVNKGSHILPWSKCVATSRYGILADQPESVWRDGVDNWEECDAALADPQWYGKGSGLLADAVNRMLSRGYFRHWEPFASTRHNNPERATHYMSLEYIHNIVHNATGGLYMSHSDMSKHPKGYKGLGLGHMSDVPVAAFDPIFWLHHCNIDRLAAIWQTLHWEKWFDRPRWGDPSPDSALLPFHDDTKSNKWNSTKCRDWKQLNYNYDDLVPLGDPVDNEARYLEDLQAHIKGLYPGTSDRIKDTAGYTLHDDKFHDYIINVTYNRYALNGRAYAILFFIGTLPEDLSQYRGSDSFVGAVYTFSSPVETDDGSVACANCAEQMSGKELSKAQIALTLPLLTKARQAREGGPSEGELPGIGLGALDPKTTEQLLGVGLQWRFVEIGGVEHEPSNFPDTVVKVMHGKGSHARGRDHLPSYQGYKQMTGATSNKLLGAGHDSTRDIDVTEDPAGSDDEE